MPKYAHVITACKKTSQDTDCTKGKQAFLWSPEEALHDKELKNKVKKVNFIEILKLMMVLIQCLEYMVKCNKSQAYAASSQTFKIELFVKIISH